MNKKFIIVVAKKILARAFSEMNLLERREYLKDHDQSRWRPGKSKIPPTKNLEIKRTIPLVKKIPKPKSRKPYNPKHRRRHHFL